MQIVKKGFVLLLALVLTLSVGCATGDGSANNTSQTNSTASLQTKTIDSKLLGISFDYPESWFEDLQLDPYIEISAGTIDKVIVSLLRDTIPQSHFDKKTMVKYLAERLDGSATIDKVLAFQCYELEHMDVIRLETKLKPYFAEYEFRGDTEYFTYWFINHHSGYSYIIECCEADKKHSCADQVDAMIRSLRFLCAPTGIEKAQGFAGYLFKYLAGAQQIVTSGTYFS